MVKPKRKKCGCPKGSTKSAGYATGTIKEDEFTVDNGTTHLLMEVQQNQEIEMWL